MVRAPSSATMRERLTPLPPASRSVRCTRFVSPSLIWSTNSAWSTLGLRVIERIISNFEFGIWNLESSSYHARSGFQILNSKFLLRHHLGEQQLLRIDHPLRAQDIAERMG